MTDNKKRKIRRVVRRAGSYKVYRKPVEKRNKERSDDPKVVERYQKKYLAHLKSIEGTEFADLDMDIDASVHDFGDYDSGYYREATVPAKKTVRRTWQKYTVLQLVRWYLAGMAVGKPDLLMVNPEQQQTTCGCKKNKKLVTLYMLGGKELRE